MKIATKFKINIIAWGWRIRRSKKLGKKVVKWQDEERYPDIWKNRYVIRKMNKFIKLLNAEIEIIGRENLPKGPFILTPNHASGFDTVAILKALETKSDNPNDLNLMPVFLAKAELNSKKNKFIGYQTILDTFYIERDKPKSSLETLRAFVEFAKNNKRVAVIFPEGTRSEDGSIGEFKTGAFREAKRQFLPIVPCTINNSLAATDFQREGNIKVQIIFGKQIKPIEFMQLDSKEIAAKVEKEVRKKWKAPTTLRVNGAKENEV